MLKLYQPSEAEKIYYAIKDTLVKKYKPDYHVVIHPKTEQYFVDKSSVSAMKKARSKYPKGKLFLAQVGRIAGLMK